MILTGHAYRENISLEGMIGVKSVGRVDAMAVLL